MHWRSSTYAWVARVRSDSALLLHHPPLCRLSAVPRPFPVLLGGPSISRPTAASYERFRYTSNRNTPARWWRAVRITRRLENWTRTTRHRVTWSGASINWRGTLTTVRRAGKASSFRMNSHKVKKRKTIDERAAGWLRKLQPLKIVGACQILAHSVSAKLDWALCSRCIDSPACHRRRNTILRFIMQVTVCHTHCQAYILLRVWLTFNCRKPQLHLRIIKSCACPRSWPRLLSDVDLKGFYVSQTL